MSAFPEDLEFDQLVIDGHNDLPWRLRWLAMCGESIGPLDRPQPGLQTDIPRLRTGGVGAQFWSVFVPAQLPAAAWWDEVLEQVSFIRALATTFPTHFAFAQTGDQVEECRRRGLIACLIGVEGGHVLQNRLERVAALRSLGARYLTLTHEDDTDWASSATGRRQGGLTSLGLAAIDALNVAGIIVDVSHCSDQTALDAARASRRPIICSHSNARAICDVQRNIPDDVITEVARGGGVVMATFAPEFCVTQHQGATRPPGEHMMARCHLEPAVAHLDDVVAHLEHLREVAGIDSVGLGSDFEGTPRVTHGLEDVSSFGILLQHLVRRGWSNRDVQKLAWENTLRVLKAHDD